MKRDYFYTSPLGRRMFQLDLGSLALSLVGAPRHGLLDRLAAEKGRGYPLCRDLLEADNIDYKRLLRHDAPIEKLPAPAPQASNQARPPVSVAPDPPGLGLPDATAAAPWAGLPGGAFAPASSSASSASGSVQASIIIDAVAAIPERRRKGEGRAADLLAKQLCVSPSTVYQALAIVKAGDPGLIEQVKKGEIGFKKACKILRQPKEAG